MHLADDTTGELTISPRHGRYLDMFNLFRVLACAAVLGQHSFIWTNMTGNFVGTGFITMLHLSRNSFFFLTALVVTYAQTTRPRPLGQFWKRRYREVGVPYLVWTGIYLIFSLITVSASWDEVGRFLRHNLFLGFSQLYFIIVIFQFYLLFPFALKFLRATRHHARVMGASLAFAALIGFMLHYPSWFYPLSKYDDTINTVVPWGRDILVYQEYFVAGMLVALHIDQVLDFVARRYRQVFFVTGVIGVLTVLWYMESVWMGASVETASDIYEPTAALWCLAAIATLFSASWLWQKRTTAHPDSRARRIPTCLATLTGGVFFAHTLFLNMLRSALDMSGLRASLPWEATVAILFVSTVTVTGCFVAVVVRTPLRWVLAGPVRTEQREAVNAAVEGHLVTSTAGTD
jgi:membrane-bound acyltransferase YfiQ involved in biofilm formation